MELNTNYYPLEDKNDNVEITKTITELTDYENYLEKSIMYACCNNKYLSYYNPSFVTRTSDSDYMHHTINTCETNKTEFVLGYNRYIGGMYSYFGGDHPKGFHGADITLLRKFEFAKTYINLDSLTVYCLNCEHANMVGRGYSLNDDKVSIPLKDYLERGVNYPIIGWSNLEIVNAVSGVNTFPAFCKEYDYSFVYTPTSFSFRADTMTYISAGASWGNVSDIKFYGVQSGWDNSANTNCGFYLNNQGGLVSCGHVLGIPNSIEDFATPKHDSSGNNPQNQNYFIPDEYDWSDSPLPIIMYDGDWQSRYYHGYSYDYFMHMIASLGLRFKLNNTMYASEIDKNGYTTGRFVPVSELDKSGFANKDWVSSDDSSYDRDFIPDKPITNDLENIGLNSNYGQGRFVRWYGLSLTDINGLESWLNGEQPSGYKPLDNFIGLTEYMFDIFDEGICSAVPETNIKIGTETYSATWNRIYDISRVIDLGSYTINRYNNDFTDFAPYSTYRVYIPYCSWVDLDSDVVVGEEINVKLIVDPITTACKGIVLVNGNIIAETNGTCGNSVPISSNNMGLLKQALLNTGVALGSSALAITGGLATGNAIAIGGGVVGAIGGITQGLANMHKTINEVKGTTGTSTQFNTYSTCVIQITHPIEKISENFAHTVGFITNKTKEIASCMGFVKCENVDTTGLSCDYAERQEIKAILETGFYC